MIYESKKQKIDVEKFKFEFPKLVKLTDDVKICFLSQKKVQTFKNYILC